MAIFPEQMNKLDYKKPDECFETMEKYIRYMVERIEFNNSNDIKRLGKADATTQDVVKMFLSTTDLINQTRAEVQQLYNATTSLSRQYAEVSTALTELAQRVETLEKGTEG
jgi:phage shock protein A